MLKSNLLLCPLIASMAVLISGPALAASGGIDDDFSTYPAGTKFDNLPQSNAGGWAWSAAYLATNEGAIEVVDGENSQKLLKAELPFPSSGSGYWRLLCELDQHLEFAENREFELQTSLRIPDVQFPMDLVIGIAAPFRKDSLGLPPGEFQPFARFLVSPDRALTQFRYFAIADGADGSEVNYLTATSFKVQPGEWYLVKVRIKPQQQTYDIEVQEGEDGINVFEALDVAWVSNFSGIAGVAFKNRTTNDLRSAKFDLRRVVLQAVSE